MNPTERKEESSQLILEGRYKHVNINHLSHFSFIGLGIKDKETEELSLKLKGDSAITRVSLKNKHKTHHI